MKVLVLNGSPREKSDTMVLTSAFVKGLTSERVHDVKVVPVIDKNIDFCRGCLSCWFRQDGHCMIEDDMNPLLDEMAASDLIIWSFPLYEYGIPAHLKAVIDRTNPFLKIDMYQTDTRVEHSKLVDLGAKKIVIITGCGFPYFPDNFAPLKLQMKNIFGAPTMICVHEVALISNPAPVLAPIQSSLLTEFTNAGKEYDRNGCISDNTLRILEKPMMENEAYIDLINHLKP